MKESTNVTVNFAISENVLKGISEFITNLSKLIKKIIKLLSDYGIINKNIINRLDSGIDLIISGIKMAFNLPDTDTLTTH
ncbi:hypothetical protein [Xenorhabdus kozodoii]|uniref:Uncharacterized protein n=1 Tax=Xenorhabdus kozodoii TaxID=351676 RepID=A0A2D0LI10_9GAMM|nr:hypothetical protein [Xenorhabdus kozodoii]PHM75251.1 hypothetical protein Xkoz_00267 [Xenorhabdus kozodoii]